MSPDARRVMDELAETYVRERFSKNIGFKMASLHPAYLELQAFGLLQPRGTQAVCFTDAGRAWVMRRQVPDDIRWARKLFTIFEQQYRQHTTGEWFFRTLDDIEAEQVGLEPLQIKSAVKVLRQTKLIETDASGVGHLQLTELGQETCLHPETLDDKLAPRGTLVDASTTNVFHGPAQIGDGNVQNVTYAVILQQLAEKIEQDPTVPPEQKSRWVEALKDIAVKCATAAAASGVSSLF